MSFKRPVPCKKRSAVLGIPRRSGPSPLMQRRMPAALGAPSASPGTSTRPLRAGGAPPAQHSTREVIDCSAHRSQTLRDPRIRRLCPLVALSHLRLKTRSTNAPFRFPSASPTSRPAAHRAPTRPGGCGQWPGGRCGTALYVSALITGRTTFSSNFSVSWELFSPASPHVSSSHPSGSAPLVNFSLGTALGVAFFCDNNSSNTSHLRSFSQFSSNNLLLIPGFRNAPAPTLNKHPGGQTQPLDLGHPKTSLGIVPAF